MIKKRKTYIYQDKYEIALDAVEKLGNFIKIEVKKYDASAIQEYDELLKLSKHLNNIEKRGYPY